MKSQKKHIKLAKKYDKEIRHFIKEFPRDSHTNLAKRIVNHYNLNITPQYLREAISAWKEINDVDDERPAPAPKDNTVKTKEKSGFEVRENYVINWSDRTIVTDLGQWGTYVASVERHQLIQKDYVYDGGDETAAIVAMKFDFAHTKAVYVYARIHGFSKASPPQTDIEFELGLTVDEAVEQNVQSMKRNVYKKTQKRKWKDTVDAAEKWWNIENTLLEQIQALAADIKEDHPKQLKFIIPQTDKKFASIIGISDVHYTKLCYNHLGKMTYNREIAKARLEDHIVKLAAETARYGRPERFYVLAGNDNIHVDGMHQSTTKLTSQAQASDGQWRLELKNYVRIQIDLINYYKQISPVTVIPVKGNHDYETSIAIQAFLEIYYEEDPLVEVVVCHDARAYVRYGNICLIATHGDELGSIKNLESQAHKLIMGEAKGQGINVQEVEYYLLLHGHEHVGSTRDLNGRVQRIGLSSLSDIDDWWHKGQGYVGRQPESQVIIVDPDHGRKAIMYA